MDRQVAASGAGTVAADLLDRVRLGAPAAAVWDALEDELRRSDALDFDDLLVRSVRLMRADPGVLADARRRWRFVLVDEFQDTNRPQWAWLELVCGHRWSASQSAVTWLSRPEKPPIATTSAPDSMMAPAAPPFWLETAGVPPPWRPK